MSNKEFYQRGALLLCAAGPSILTTADLLKDELKSSHMYRFANFIWTVRLKSFFENKIKKEIISENCKKNESYFSKAKVEKVYDEWNSEELTKRTISYKISPSESIIFELFEKNGRLRLGCSLKESHTKKLSDGLSVKDSKEELRNYQLNGVDYYINSRDALEDIKRAEFVSSVFEKLQKFSSSKDRLFLDFSKKPLLVNFLGKNLKVESVSVVPVVPVDGSKGAGADLLICCASEKGSEGSNDYMLTEYLLNSRGYGNKLKIKEMQIFVDTIVSELNKEKVNTGEASKLSQVNYEQNW